MSISTLPKGHQPTGRLVAHGHSQRRPDEGGECEDGTRTRGSERPLRQQVETQTQTVAGGPDCKKSQRCARRRQRFTEARREKCGGDGTQYGLGEDDLARVALCQRAR